ncbi:MAG: glutamine synthetase III [Bacteroidetes bacterium]|nr:glutamine synthetase III [Bacteroidota bacterium]GDX48273.1 glutamine synthetase [Bacteroidota bacterium]
MINIRVNALQQLRSNRSTEVETPKKHISEYYGAYVFHEQAMKAYLSKEAFKSVMHSINSGSKIDRSVAEQVASAMKAWAMNNGATHFTHWFQPLTGSTAEKHDSFFQQTTTGHGIELFEGDSLVQQEPDASSFPSGGLRNTFEARGYTAWDPSSPAFIMETPAGKTLCIPTIYVSYTGEALDYKAPLLKSMQALEKASVDVCHYFDKNVTKVFATLGWEQEYFVVDEALYEARPDLLMCGRTLFGAAPAKGQQLEDHYFGSIPERVYQFMVDFESECFLLGIPLKTRHNEVAPSQFECAPFFEEVNIAIDHNQLLMDVLDRVARRNHLRVLLHEKPFAGINGSGKHNNWSMATDTGKNLLSPGKTPKTNLQFLTFFVNTIKAVNEHPDLIRASIASASNDFRLGANEAPPAIISVFIGKYLTDVLNEVESRVKSGKFSEQDEQTLRLDIHNKIPDLLMDNTDRNRTSPFAFTGNKFEVRAVGSSANCSSTMTVLNTIMADQLVKFKTEVDALIKKGENREVAILHVLKGYITSSKRILFEGNNYSVEWEKEAKKRGLNNIKTTPTALDAYSSKDTIALFERNKVFTKVEVHARHEIELEKYIKKVQIESRVLGEMVLTHIIPAAVEYQSRLLTNINGLKEAGVTKKLYEAQLSMVTEISEHIMVIRNKSEAMVEARKQANNVEDIRAKAIAYCDKVKPYLEEIRYHVDKLEIKIDDKLWPVPKYRELLFLR